jgi:hypothetical protein
MARISINHKFFLFLAGVALAAIVIIAKAMNTNREDVHTPNAIDTRHTPAAIVSRERYLWSAIYGEIDSNSTHQTMNSICHSIEVKDPALLTCPVSQTRLAINPNISLWKSSAEPDTVAVISMWPIENCGQMYYQAISFQGVGIKVSCLPCWASSTGRDDL